MRSERSDFDGRLSTGFAPVAVHREIRWRSFAWPAAQTDESLIEPTTLQIPVALRLSGDAVGIAKRQRQRLFDKNVACLPALRRSLAST